MLSRKINNYFSLESYKRKLAIFERHNAYSHGSIFKDHSAYRIVQRWMIRWWWQTGKNLKEGVVAKLKTLYQNVHERTKLNHDRHVRIVGVPIEIRKWKFLRKKNSEKLIFEPMCLKMQRFSTKANGTYGYHCAWSCLNFRHRASCI